MSNALSVYWTPHHRRPTDYEYMLALQPAVVKLMDAGPPDYQWVRLNLPGSLVIARDWALSEQKSDMLADPAGTGARHAWEWSEKCDDLGFDPGNTLVLGINEPPVWDAGVIPALVSYTVAFLDGCTQHGLRGGALQLSVGWPANIGEGTAPDWGPYTPVEAAIKRGKHALVLHEYWADQGPSEEWGWKAGRFMKCPWDVPIIIGETGVDMYSKSEHYEGNRGWQGHMNAYAYGAQCAEYVHLCQQDARFFAATVFETDYAAGEWQSFDTEPAWRELVSESQGLPPAQWYAGSVPTPEPPTPTPQPPQTGTLVHPLPKGQYAITQRFNETGLNAEGHEGTDFGATSLTPVYAMADGVVAWVGLDGQGYGIYVRLYHAALGVHSFYAHLSGVDVLMGNAVHAGQVIGTVGSTGNSTGPHLHYEIRVGDEEGYSPAAPKPNGRIDPESYCALFGLSLATGETVGGVQTVYMPLVSSV